MSARPAWNGLGWLLYLILPGLGWLALMLAGGLLTGVAACTQDSCRPGFGDWAAMVTLAVGAPAVAAGTAVVMLREHRAGQTIVGWPIVGVILMAGVFGTAAWFWYFLGGHAR